MQPLRVEHRSGEKERPVVQMLHRLQAAQFFHQKGRISVAADRRVSRCYGDSKMVLDVRLEVILPPSTSGARRHGQDSVHLPPRNVPLSNYALWIMQRGSNVSASNGHRYDGAKPQCLFVIFRRHNCFLNDVGGTSAKVGNSIRETTLCWSQIKTREVLPFSEICVISWSCHLRKWHWDRPTEDAGRVGLANTRLRQGRTIVLGSCVILQKICTKFCEDSSSATRHHKEKSTVRVDKRSSNSIRRFKASDDFDTHTCNAI